MEMELDGGAGGSGTMDAEGGRGEVQWSKMCRREEGLKDVSYARVGS